MGSNEAAGEGRAEGPVQKGSSARGAFDKGMTVAQRLRLQGLNALHLILIALIVLYGVLLAIGEGQFRLAPGSITDQAGDLVSFALLCALLSFATIELVKRSFKLRSAYQRHFVADWLSSRELAIQVESPRSVEELKRPSTNAAFRELMVELGPSYGAQPWKNEVFGLPVEQLSAQLGSAVESVYQARPRSILIRAVARDRSFSYTAVEQGNSSTDEEREVLFQQRLRGGLDQLQIALSARWRRHVQLTAVWLTGLFGIALSQTGAYGNVAASRYVLSALLVGGVLSWLIRDAFAAVERLRR